MKDSEKIKYHAGRAEVHRAIKQKNVGELEESLQRLKEAVPEYYGEALLHVGCGDSGFLSGATSSKKAAIVEVVMRCFSDYFHGERFQKNQDALELSYRSAMLSAAYDDNAKMMEVLLKYIPQESLGRTAEFAWGNIASKRMAELLLPHVPDEKFDEYVGNGLKHAMTWGHVEAVQYILQHKDRFSESPFDRRLGSSRETYLINMVDSHYKNTAEVLKLVLPHLTDKQLMSSDGFDNVFDIAERNLRYARKSSFSERDPKDIADAEQVVTILALEARKRRLEVFDFPEDPKVRRGLEKVVVAEKSRVKLKK